MRTFIFVLALISGGCAMNSSLDTSQRSAALRDMESYAIASCLTLQPQQFLKDQGDAWASVIVQRMKGSPEVLAGIFEEVQAENLKGDMAISRDESGKGPDKALPLLYCYEIVGKPGVRTSIQKAAKNSR